MLTKTGARPMMRRLCFAAMLVACVVACAPEPVDPAFDEDAANKLLVKYEEARTDEDYESAEFHADELRRRHGETRAAAKMRSTLAQVQERAEARREKRRLADLWDYQRIAVESGGTQHSAAIYSRVEVDPEGEAPPATPDARLIFRRHPEWGESAYLVLAQSELKCGPPCVLEIRFDDGEPQKYAGDPADTGTGPALFIVDRDRFLAALRDADRVHIRLPETAHLRPSFSFEVGGFSPDRHLAD